MQTAITKPFSSASCRISPRIPVRLSGVLRRLPCLLKRTQATGNDGPQGSQASVDDEVLPIDEIQRLAGLRRQQQAGFAKDSNVLQGALEEAQLITWPKPSKAALDTVLVLFIVTLSGAFLFGLNVLLAELSEYWYHLG